MPTVSTYNPTGDAYVDGVLVGMKWATTSLTFSFPTDASFYGSSYGYGEPTSNFKAFTTTQQTAVRTDLQMYSAVSNLTFTEVSETSSQHGDLRYAESDAPSTAWGYYPSMSAEGGDVWFNNSSHWYDSPLKGNYAWLTTIHETGHALGLKHPQDVMGAFGAMPLDHDSLEYSVMSYRSYVGGSTSGYTNASDSYPQTLMMYDIAAIQVLYGANYTTNGGDTVYSWNPTTGQEYINGVGQGAPVGNKIFMTLWDGGGNDTYDFSSYTSNLTVNLQPGAWTITSGTAACQPRRRPYRGRQYRQCAALQQQPGLADRKRRRRLGQRQHHRQRCQQPPDRRSRQRRAERRQRHRHRGLFRAVGQLPAGAQR